MREIRKRLNCVHDDDAYWRTQILNIEKKIFDYESSRRRTPGGNHEHILHNILPVYWEVFHTHNIYQRKKNQLPSRGDDTNHLPCYDIGIFLVGFSTLPIVLSLAEIQPLRQIYFLYSTDTVKMLEQIKDMTSAMLPGSDLSALVDTSVDIKSDFALEIERPSNPVETFKQIKEIIDTICENLEPEIEIALDLTGGKKTMIGGGFTAGSILGFGDSIDMFYVDSLEYNSILGSPNPGTEFLSQLENPYDVYNVQSVQEAEALFYEHNYEAALYLWRDVKKTLDGHANRYSLQSEQNDVEKKLHMADCYSPWDAFDYIAAKDSKEDHGTLWDYNIRHTWNAHATNIDVLTVLSEVRDPETLFAEEARIIHYAVDRYQNGIRRMESDRFDDAIVRFTQVVEILCRYYVYQITEDGCLEDENGDPVSPGCCLDEIWSIRKLIGFLFNSGWNYDRRYYISDEGWRLDIAKYNDDENVGEITNLIQRRNDFVHVKSNPGWEEMRNGAENLKDLAKIFLENFSQNYCCNNHLSFCELLKLHEFHRLE